MARTVLPRQWGVPSSLEDFARRITSLEKKVLGLLPRSALLDSGEVLVPIVDAQFEPYSPGASDPVVRRIGKTVEFYGGLRSQSVMSGSTINEVMHIPEGFRPAGPYQRIFVCQGSFSNRWAMTVSHSAGTSVGRVDVGRYGPSASGANTWMPFAVSWITDDPWPT